MIHFVVPSVPVAQPRVKATNFGGHSRVYTPTKTTTGRTNGIAEYKASVRHSFAAVYGGAPTGGPLSLQVLFVLPRTKGQFWKRQPMPRLWHEKKPDVDNLVKSLCDALTGLAWVDDTQVCHLSVQKVIAAGDEQPHVDVTISPIRCEPVRI